MNTPTTLPWRQFLCRACGLIYDEELGDPDSGLAPGTRFDDIPEDWACPLCGVVKADFEPYEPLERTALQTDAAAVAPSRELGVVIVGGGIAGWSAAEALRALDPAVPITLVTACNGDRYLKPELSVALGRCLKPADLVRESAVNAARRLNVRLMTETFVVGISPSLNQVRTTRGAIRYTKLVVAQGARPALPEQMPASLCWRVNDLAGWSGLQARLDGAKKHVAIVGAGMIGCELAEDFARAGHAVSLIDVNPGPLASLVPAIVSEKLLTSLQDGGVRFLGGRHIEKIEKAENDQKDILLQGTEQIRVDEVVAATGLVTETRLAKMAGLAFDRGIVVDPLSMQTSVEDIYAIGDCISVAGVPCRFIEPIVRQAGVLSHHALNREHAGYVHSTPMIRLKTKAFPVVLHGVPRSDGTWSAPEDRDGQICMEQSLDGRVIARIEAGVTKQRLVA
ncbi:MULTISPECIES: FAD-dependent oxidoreductase [Paraburkholderia]|uniref:FAD-dependent oxidoreductase n=1 Tax=Paraburkholderia TaxID=1822464 RepID=UPI002AB777C7|nr:MULTISPECIES: FAD-dependent oxidoreductase [Paraburkholderia]